MIVRAGPRPCTLATRAAFAGLVWLAPCDEPLARAECPPSTLTTDGSLDMDRWSAAVDAMRSALVGTDRPWHCAGSIARVVALSEGRGAIEVTLATGVTLRRVVREPREALETLQALLIVEVIPRVEDPPRARETTPASDPLSSRVRTASQRATVPQVARGASGPPRTAPAATRWVDGFIELGPRVGGPAWYTSFASRLTAAFRFEPWSLLVWARVEPWTTRLVDRGPGRYLLDPGVLGVGATWGARTVVGRWEAGATLSTNTYTWRDQGLAVGQRESFAQVRVGALARWRFRPESLGLSVALDGDLAPASWLEPPPTSTLPSAPAWSAGLLAGIAYGGLL